MKLQIKSITPKPLRAHDYTPARRGWLRVGDRCVNPAMIAQVRITGDDAAVWLIGQSEPLHASGADAHAVRMWMTEVMA